MTTSKIAPTYIAITATEGDWYVEFIGQPGEAREQVKHKAERQICGDQWDTAKDIRTDTALKNLQVVSVSQARRDFPQAMRQYDNRRMYEPDMFDETGNYRNA